MRCPVVANNWVSLFFQMHCKPIANFDPPTRHGYGSLIMTIFTLIICFYRLLRPPSHDRSGQSPTTGRGTHFFTNLLHFLTLFQSLRRLLDRMRELKVNPDFFILIVILPNSAGPIRNTVKHWGDVKYGTSSVSINLLDV